MNLLAPKFFTASEPARHVSLARESRARLIGANRPETSGTVTDFLPVSRTEAATCLVCPGNKSNSSDPCIYCSIQAILTLNNPVFCVPTSIYSA